ncbi:hypothetical protein ACIRPN_26115 [Streptomyces sp. NPDC101230]|uniref:hypothetical protein n=1 Tax=unclassified Streptomyces TaxID=2593676 RepID=UPI00380DDF9C
MDRETGAPLTAENTTLDRGRFPDAVTPWEHAVRRAEALGRVNDSPVGRPFPSQPGPARTARERCGPGVLLREPAAGPPR